MSADSFLLALERFISRRGLPQLFYSDNGLAFKLVSQEIGANRRSKKSAIAVLADRNIGWRFIPEYAPWWGGFWERLVGSVKQHLRKTIGNAKLKAEELQTALAKIEAVVNSRPLSTVSEDVEEPVPL